MHNPKHVRACVWLVIATALWGVSFPLVHASWLLQKQLAPGISSVFFAASLAVVRFSVAGLIIALFAVRTLRTMTRLEWQQGVGLGLFGGLGILFQMDGLAHISHNPASTSAFLTQFSCIAIPIWVAWTKRALPKFVVIVSCIMVLTGVAILSQFDWRAFTMGRGEAETILSAILFAGQILWLERPRYTGNRVTHFTVVMFATITVLIAPLVVAAAPTPRAFIAIYSSWPVLVLIGGIVFICTLGAYTLMNVWQPHVTATEAGLIYCVEPICASMFAAFLPGWISRLGNIDYANEHLTQHLLIGGILITAANILIQVEAMLRRRKGNATR